MFHDQINVMLGFHNDFEVDWLFYFDNNKIIFVSFERLDQPARLPCNGSFAVASKLLPY